MASEHDASSAQPPQYGGKAAFFLVLTILFGFLVAMFVTENPESILRWFWIGIAICVIYLLAAIATNLKRLRNES